MSEVCLSPVEQNQLEITPGNWGLSQGVVFSPWKRCNLSSKHITDRLVRVLISLCSTLLQNVAAFSALFQDSLYFIRFNQIVIISLLSGPQQTSEQWFVNACRFSSWCNFLLHLLVAFIHPILSTSCISFWLFYWFPSISPSLLLTYYLPGKIR